MSVLALLQDIERKKALEALESQAQELTENVHQPTTAEKTECVDDKNDKAQSRGM